MLIKICSYRVLKSIIDSNLSNPFHECCTKYPFSIYTIWQSICSLRNMCFLLLFSVLIQWLSRASVICVTFHKTQESRAWRHKWRFSFSSLHYAKNLLNWFKFSFVASNLNSTLFIGVLRNRWNVKSSLYFTV